MPKQIRNTKPHLFFVKSQVSVIAFDVDENDLPDDPFHSIQAVVLDIGFTFGKEFELNDKPLYLGISFPTYFCRQLHRIDDFDDDDFDWADEYVEKLSILISVPHINLIKQWLA